MRVRWPVWRGDRSSECNDRSKTEIMLDATIRATVFYRQIQFADLNRLELHARGVSPQP